MIALKLQSASTMKHIQSLAIIAYRYPCNLYPVWHVFVRQIAHSFARQGVEVTVITPLAIHRAWQSIAGMVRPGHRKKDDAPAKEVRRGLWPALKYFVLAVLFFHVTCIGWLLFRAGSVPSHFDQVQIVFDYLRAMFHWPLAGVSALAWPVILLGGLAMFFQWQYEKMDHFSKWKTHWKATAVALALAAIIGLGVFKGAQFIYFQF